MSKQSRSYFLSKHFVLLLLLLYFTSPELQAVECLLTRPGLVLTNDEFIPHGGGLYFSCNDRQTVPKYISIVTPVILGLPSR